MIRRERRDGGEGEEREGSREKRQNGAELTTEEEDKEHRHLPLLVVSFLKALSSRLDSAVKRYSIEL